MKRKTISSKVQPVVIEMFQKQKLKGSSPPSANNRFVNLIEKKTPEENLIEAEEKEMRHKKDAEERLKEALDGTQ